MPKGLIIKGVGGNYTVKSEDQLLYTCKARGVFRNDGIKPLPGDRVEFDIVSDEFKEGLIVNILKRKNELIRPAVANVDHIAIIMAAESPMPDFYLIDKLIVSAFSNNIEPLLCINKIDLRKEYAQDIFNIYSTAGIKTILLSSKRGVGIDELKQALSNKITVFAGQSGAGKSTTINKIFDDEVMETGQVSARLQRGVHTTRHVELFEINNGYIMDSPGFSSFDIADIEISELSFYYPEFKEFLNVCKFRECLHINEPACAVKDAVSSGIIDKDRYSRYVTFISELKSRKDNKYK